MSICYVIMMQIEPKSLSFSQHRTSESITLINNTAEKYTFKIKVTNMSLFNICPGRGEIQPSDSLSIQVTLKTQQLGFNAKLLVQYAPVPDNGQEVNWSQLDKSTIKDQLISIAGGKQGSNKSQLFQNFKKTESPLYQQEIEGSISSHMSLKRPKQAESAVHRSSSKTIYQTITENQRIQRSTTTHMKMQESGRSNVERQLKKEKRQNDQLRKRLAQRDKRLMHFQDLSQKRINESVKEENQSFHFGACNIILLVLVCLFFGFLIARMNPSSYNL